MTPNDAANDPVIVAEGLEKRFVVRERKGVLTRTKRERIAVSDVHLTIRRGEMVGFIGPNGAGKSTTIKMLTGILAPTAGTVRVLGHVPLEERTRLSRRIGVVFGQRSQLWWDLPLLDSFQLLRHMYRIAAADYERSIESLSTLFELVPFMNTPVRQLSLGQRMRGEITAALLHEPELLFLDEPTIGLDLVAKQAVRDALRTVNRERSTTVILTTHDLSDVNELCERIVIIDGGCISFDGELRALMERVGARRRLIADFAGGSSPPGVGELRNGSEVVESKGTRLVVEFDRSRTTAASLLAELSTFGEIRDLEIVEPAIEEIVRRVYESGPTS